MSTERKPRKSSAKKKGSTPAAKPRAKKVAAQKPAAAKPRAKKVAAQKPAAKPRAKKVAAQKPAAKPRAKKVAAQKPGRALPPSTPIIPYKDELMGKQFSANVNCRPVVNRQGKTRQKCDRQRLVVTGGASPSAEHPKRKQMFAVQAGQRHTIPDRELRRDLRESAKVRERYSESATCDTYRDQIMSGGNVPRAAYERCPDLPDAIEPPPGAIVDTSFDVKENRRKRKPNHHHGFHAAGDPLGVYLPPLGAWGRRGHRYSWIHTQLGWMFYIRPDPSGYGFEAGVIADANAPRQFRFPTPASGTVQRPIYEVVVQAGSPEMAHEALAHWYSYVRPHGAAKSNGARYKGNPPKGLAPGQTYQDGRKDPLRGLRVSGDRYAGEIRTRAVGCDGKTPAHITGGYILPRSRVSASVRRDERLAAERAAQVSQATMVPTMSIDEGLRRMDQILAAPEPEPMRAPLQLGPGYQEPEVIVPIIEPPPVMSPVIEEAVVMPAAIDNAQHLIEILRPGAIFTVLTDSEAGFPGSATLKVTDTPARGPRGTLVIGVKEPRGRKLLTYTMRPNRRYWVWFGEVKLQNPRVMGMFDDALMPAIGVTAPYAPTMMGTLADPYVPVSEERWAMIREATPQYDEEGLQGVIARSRAGGGMRPASAPVPQPPPRRSFGAGGADPVRPRVVFTPRNFGAGTAEPLRPRPAPIASAAEGEMSDEEMGALFEQYMAQAIAGAVKPNGRYPHAFRVASRAPRW